MYNDYSKILKAALAKGGDYADLFIEETRPVAISLEDGKVEKVISGREIGAGIRVIIGFRSIYAYTNDIGERALLDLAASVARAVNGDGRDLVIDLRQKKPVFDFSVAEPPEGVDIARKLALVRSMDGAARAADTRVSQVMVMYRDTVQDITIASSDGFLAKDQRHYTVAAANVIAKDANSVQTGYESAGGNAGLEIFKATPPELIGEKAAKRATQALTARKAPGGSMPVVLSSEAGGTMVHEAVGHGLEADLAQNGLSVYTGKIGEQIGSPLVTVLDDATIPGKRGSFRFDDEGIEAQKTVLVEGGVLKGFMYDRLTAMKDKAVSTGNGRRDSYQSRPIPRMTNTLIAPGASDPADIIRACEKGLLIKKMGGGQVNTVNGDFVFEINEAFIIENGQVGEPVRGATLVGNGPQVLKDVAMVGTDLGYSIGTCGKDSQGAPVSDAQPTLLISNIVVGGSHEE